MVNKMAFLAVSVGVLAWCGGCPLSEPGSDSVEKPKGLVQLIEFHDIQGLRNWAHELQKRDLKSLVFIQSNMLQAYPDDIKWLADQGHEIGGGYAEEALWDIPYDTQLSVMQETKELLKSVTGRPMRVFGSRYFAYDENTLKAADTLGVEYVLARGTSDVEALIYEPDEHNCKIISVSNVTFEDMGRGSLCDYSLWARGSTASEFEQVLEETLAKHPKRLMVVSHAYLGGMKKEWWDVYSKLLDNGEIRWAPDFDEWITAESGVNLRVPLSMVPDNREVTYAAPSPSVPLEEMEDVDQMHNPCGAP
ncbi:MAG: polysaccharide deacetylase family protein [Phycisphaerae bacterium]|jgi:peptidoglycan/xylan/chitin deacetylase (PgdA/CDA1 family)